MLGRMICLTALVVLLSPAGDVQAAVIWTDSGAGHLWSTPENWSTGKVPIASDHAKIEGLPGAIVANEGAVAAQMHVASSGPRESVLTVDGGSLTVAAWLIMAGSAAAQADIEGTFNINDGTVRLGRLDIAHTGKGTLNMNGGSLTVTGPTTIAGKSKAVGHVNLNGGVMNVNNLLMRSQAGSVGTIDVAAGTLTMNGDAVSTLQGYIDNGWITAYGGNGTLQLDYDVTNEGRTTLRATHLLDPNPADGGTVGPGQVELSWTLPDPCVPGQPVAVDVYFTDDLQALEWFTDPAAIQVVGKQSVTSAVVQAQPKTRYYWAVDTYIGDPNDPIFGPIFSFVADNLAPEVNAGQDVVTWLDAGGRTGNLDATVIDSDAYTVQWTVVSEPDDPNSPDASIADPSAEDTSITLSALGEYVLQLEAFDGEYSGSDTVTISVYYDNCQAAQSLPDYVPLAGDINGDCIVDDVDLALLQENWLKDSLLTEVWLKVD
ncbi:MAG TPA: hypothetical protein ENI81_04875 [Phycisphaerales bacterium]|nr:hypothetical protein [Phycisphaerales bacterium]